MNLEKALSQGHALGSLGWRPHNLEFERRKGRVVELVALRRGKPLALARVDLPEAQARRLLRLHGYRRRFRRLSKGLWGAERLLQGPRSAKAFARRYAAWDSCVMEFLHGNDVRLAEVDGYLSCSFAWFPGEGASWTIGLHSLKTRRRPDLRRLTKAARTLGFNGSARPYPMKDAIWFPIHDGLARFPVLPFARRFLRFLEVIGASVITR
jgi:hypothetical protein